MNKQANLLFGILIGAAVMYLLDPDRGRRRRSLLRDRLVHGANELDGFGHGIASRARHLRNRARGAAIETRTRLALAREEVDDAVLEARVRSQLGRLIESPGDIAISAEHGRVTLRGSAPYEAMVALVDGVQNIPGVHDVINRVEAPRSAG